ncbi:MAG: DUF417 family protein [Rubrobacter sp.]|jgi:uncharacterized membrane protein YkgB|nr:DUF417 family protein [Rubrobacter sp.]
MNIRNVAARTGANGQGRMLETAGVSVLRSALAGTLLWVGALKFAEYEAENIRPMVSTSPLFSSINERLGARKTARLIGLTEIAMGTLIAARPLSPRASAIGSLGATGMFLSTLSFLLTMPGVWQEEHGFPALSLEGQFLAKDWVFLGAAMLTAAESLRAPSQ